MMVPWMLHNRHYAEGTSKAQFLKGRSETAATQTLFCLRTEIIQVL